MLTGQGLQTITVLPVILQPSKLQAFMDDVHTFSSPFKDGVDFGVLGPESSSRVAWPRLGTDPVNAYILRKDRGLDALASQKEAADNLTGRCKSLRGLLHRERLCDDQLRRARRNPAFHPHWSPKAMTDSLIGASAFRQQPLN